MIQIYNVTSIKIIIIRTSNIKSELYVSFIKFMYLDNINFYLQYFVTLLYHFSKKLVVFAYFNTFFYLIQDNALKIAFTFPTLIGNRRP